MRTAIPEPVDPSKLSDHDLSHLLCSQDRVGDKETCACGKPTLQLQGPLPLSQGANTHSSQCAECDPIVATIHRLRVAHSLAAAEHQRQQQDERRLSEVGQHFVGCTVDNFVPKTASQQQALDAVRGKWWKRHAFLLLAGAPGRGKTHLAVAAYREAQDHGVQPRFVGETHFLHLWRRAAAQRIAFDGVEVLMNAPILIFDDIGTGKYTDGSLELLYQIVDHRSRTHAPTLLTSNLTVDALDARWGEKIVSRILEISMGKVLLIDGDNHRTRAA